MKLRQPFYKLPFRFDVKRLSEEVRAIPEEAWRPHPSGYAGNTALILVSAYGKQNDDTKGPMQATEYLEQAPYIQQVMAAFDTVVGRSRLMRLEAESDVKEHTDIAYYWRTRTRIHIPVVTDPSVIFHCEDHAVHMAAGESWTFDNWRMHRVENPSNVTRIHLVVDTVGSASFVRMLRQIERGELPEQEVPYDAAARMPRLIFEHFESAPVMAPGEMDRNCEVLVDDLRARADNDAELIDDVEEQLEEIAHSWRSVWVAHGPSKRAWPRYQAVVEEAMKLATHLPQTLRVASNGMTASAIIRADFSVALDRNAQQPGVVSALTEAQAAEGARKVASPRQLATAAAGMAAAGGRDGIQLAPNVPAAPARERQRRRAGTGGGAAAGQGGRRGRQQRAAGSQVMVNFDRPVFIVAAPRSGSTMLFETLAKNREFWTVGDESHRQIEGIRGLHPKDRDFDSNRLSHVDATPAIIDALRQAFARDARSADGTLLREMAGRAGTARIRFLEKTPKNALRIPFLRAAFPNARFVFLHRGARDNISSLLDSWRSGRYVTYRGLPGWTGELPWSHLLTPGWRDLVGKPLPEIVAEQWIATNRIILDDLENLPADHWCSVRYEDVLENPAKNLRRLCEFAGVPFGARMEDIAGKPLAPSKYTLTAPDPDKWKKNEAELVTVLDRTEEMAKRLSALKQ